MLDLREAPTAVPARPGRAARTHGTEPSARVLIADAYAPVRLGLRVALEAAGFEIAGEASSRSGALALALAEAPDLVLIDLSLPGGALGATRAITVERPETAVVILATAGIPEDVLRAIRAGAWGYLLKDMDVERLAIAIRAVLDGEAAIPRALVGRLVEEIQDRARSRVLPLVRGQRVRLTPREAEVLDLMRHELPTREIARRLAISEVTVRRHASAVLRKLDVPDRRAALGLVGVRGSRNDRAVRASV
jgi:DNA-binding NarL/FixJ family response regulator